MEETEKTKDSRLARRFITALPIELPRRRQVVFLQEFVREQFAAEGMCADVAIRDTNDHNPHTRILLTVRPLAEAGVQQYKTEEGYLCVKDGEERSFTAAEFKSTQTKGWEKQYQYKVDKKKVYMVPSQAEEHGDERASKCPKSTKYGRQNPISAHWNSEEQLLVWRETWAAAANRYLELAGHNNHIDHRSHMARGLEERPTIHEGVAAQALERRGILSDRCELNRQIKADNALLRELETELKKLSDLVVYTMSTVTERLEKLHDRALISCYQLSHIRVGRERYQDTLNMYQPRMTRYIGLVRQIKDKNEERKVLLAEKRVLPAREIFKRKELTARIAGLTGDLGKLRSERALLLQQFEYAEDARTEASRKDIAVMESGFQKLVGQEQEYPTALDKTLEGYAEVEAQAVGLDPVELYEAQLVIRDSHEAVAQGRIELTFDKQYSPIR